CDRAGTATGSVLVLVALALFPALAPRALLGFAVLLAFAALWLARRLHAGYVHSLEDSLRSGVPLDDPSRVELGLSQTQTRLSRADLARQIEGLRRDNL